MTQEIEKTQKEASQEDNFVYWLSKNENNSTVIMCSDGISTKCISSNELEDILYKSKGDSND